jgi:hypothetical protein
MNIGIHLYKSTLNLVAELGPFRSLRPKREAWGGIVGAIIDPDGTLVRIIQNGD